jgi:hypothetical protein
MFEMNEIETVHKGEISYYEAPMMNGRSVCDEGKKRFFVYERRGTRCVNDD